MARGSRKRREQRRQSQNEWTPFESGGKIHSSDPRLEELETYVNNKYQVFVNDCASTGGMPRMVHLSIKTHDRKPSRDWRDFQRIKNELCGTKCEAVELFPSESRMTDMANQYHLWVLEPNLMFPFGFQDGRAVSTDPEVMAEMTALAEKMGIEDRSKQREFAKHHLPDDCPEIGPVWLKRM